MKKILIIEDELDISELVTMVLEDEDYQVKQMSSATGFESMLRKYKADLVLLDLNIAGFDGCIICRYIKSDKELNDTPVILLSANINIAEAKEDCGADDLISKPFDLDYLINKVNAYA
jgi:DNA-binding response OmpR family regulator